MEGSTHLSVTSRSPRSCSPRAGGIVNGAQPPKCIIFRSCSKPLRSLMVAPYTSRTCPCAKQVQLSALWTITARSRFAGVFRIYPTRASDDDRTLAQNQTNSGRRPMAIELPIVVIKQTLPFMFSVRMPTADQEAWVPAAERELLVRLVVKMAFLTKRTYRPPVHFRLGMHVMNVAGNFPAAP